MNSQELRSLISKQVDVRWSDWAPKHPHLAEAIDRVQLTESTVRMLREDPDFVEAMQLAEREGAELAKATHLLDLTESLVRRLLPI